jgi:hypothetical protein
MGKYRNMDIVENGLKWLDWMKNVRNRLDIYPGKQRNISNNYNIE